MDDYIAKPIDVEGLFVALEALGSRTAVPRASHGV
jgi:DNA-binding response OmpR family regulator